MVVVLNFLKEKKLILLIFFLFFFSTSSYSQNFKFTKIINLEDPWGSSFLNEKEIIVTEKSGKIKVVNIQLQKYFEIKHNLNQIPLLIPDIILVQD